MKETFYFSHDYNARTDEKIKLMMRKHGALGYGIYWCIVEDLYNNANALRLDCEGIAYDLRTEEKIVESVIKDFGLFVINDDMFSSNSVQRRLDDRTKKSEDARKSAEKRWKNANAVPTHSERNAIKESKGNKIKEKKVNIITPEQEKLFEEFWKYYPRKTGKLAAQKAFVNGNYDPEKLKAILDAVVIQTFSGMLDAGEFTPHPATWLNQERWTDQIIEKGKNGTHIKAVDRGKGAIDFDKYEQLRKIQPT